MPTMHADGSRMDMVLSSVYVIVTFSRNVSERSSYDHRTWRRHVPYESWKPIHFWVKRSMLRGIENNAGVRYCAVVSAGFLYSFCLFCHSVLPCSIITDDDDPRRYWDEFSRCGICHLLFIMHLRLLCKCQCHCSACRLKTSVQRVKMSLSLSHTFIVAPLRYNYIININI